MTKPYTDFKRWERDIESSAVFCEYTLRPSAACRRPFRFWRRNANLFIAKKWYRTMNRSGKMAMGLYLEAGFNPPFSSVCLKNECAWPAKNRAGLRTFVLLCHRPSTAHRSLYGGVAALLAP